MKDHPALFCLRNPNFEIRISNSIPAFHFSPSPPRAPRGAAFSLTEVVIALGIFAVSMVGVLALFPVASATGRESSEETQAAIVAQMIMDELRASAESRGRTNAFFVRGQNTGAQGDLQSVNLNNAGTYLVAFDVALRNKANAGAGDPMIGPPIALKAFYNRTVASLAYSNALTSISGVTYLGQVRVVPVPNQPGLAAVTVEISTPANVTLTNRRSFQFSSLVTGP